MNFESDKLIKVAILDLYEGAANQGMRCIREILNQFADANNINLDWDEFDVRQKMEVPNLDYDIYISSGGPGSPLTSEGSEWENIFFNWIASVEKYNQTNEQKKKVFFICHSYQLACRYFNIGKVCPRKSTAFGVFPIHLLPQGKDELIFEGLNDPFYSVDSRDFQVIEPNYSRLMEIGGDVLALEKIRPHIDLERAVMAARFNDHMIGTQFHPEADAVGMSMYLQTEEKKKTVIENHGEAKWQSMIEQLNDPDKIMWTYSHIIPNFLQDALQQLIEVPA